MIKAIIEKEDCVRQVAAVIGSLYINCNVEMEESKEILFEVIDEYLNGVNMENMKKIASGLKELFRLCTGGENETDD